jgi:hypothetical protein
VVEEKLLAKLREEQFNISTGLVEFPLHDFAAYQKKVGAYQGLQYAIDQLTLLLNPEEDE